MKTLGLWTLLVACGPRIRHIEAVEVGARDGAIVSAPSLSIPILGQGALAPPELFEALERLEPSLVVLAGDSVGSSKLPDWQRLAAIGGELPILPAVGAGERRGDPRLRGFRAIWDGLGVEGLSGEVSWYAVDLHTEGARWRIVVLDGDRDALGTSLWLDQSFWIPKVVGDDGYDHLIVVLCGGPGRLDVTSWALSAGVSELMSLVRRHTDPRRMLLWVGGGGHAPGLVLPGGRWGEAWLTTGRSSLPAVPLLYSSGGLSLEPGLQLALLDAFERRAGEELESLQGLRGFPPELTPVVGWWELGLAGSELSLSLHLGGEGPRWPVVYQLVWSPGGGWGSAP